MIANFTKGSNVKAMILYNENKVSSGTAELLFTQNLLVNHPSVYEAAFTNLISQTQMEAPTFHASLSFSPEESLSNEKMQAIANRYMSEMGYSKQPFVVYRHHDTKHQHVHILSVNIDENNKRIPEWNDHFKSQKISREIETVFNLVQVNSQKLTPTAEDVEKPKNFKSHVAKTALEIKNRFHPTDFDQLSKIFESKGITIVPVQASLDTPKGFVFRSSTDPDQKPIKASHLYHKFNEKVVDNLLAKASSHKESFDKTNLVAKVSKVLDLKVNVTFSELELKLKSIDVVPVWEKYKDGNIYGVSFIDETSGLVFKGSELHRNFSFSKIKTKIIDQTTGANDSINIKKATEPSTDQKKVATTFDSKEFVNQLLNQVIRTHKIEMEKNGQQKINRSEVLKNILSNSSDAYENAVKTNDVYRTLSPADITDVNKTLEKRITWLTGSGIGMAEANEGMQLFIQDSLRNLNSKYSGEPQELLSQIEELVPSVTTVFSQKVFLEESPSLAEIHNRADAFAWKLALDGVQDYTKAILIDKAASLRTNINLNEKLNELIDLKIEFAKTNSAVLTSSDFYFNNHGQDLIQEIGTYIQGYTNDLDQQAKILERVIIGNAFSRMANGEIRTITDALTAQFGKGTYELSQLQLDITGKTMTLFDTTSLLNASPSLKSLYGEFNETLNLDSALTNLANAQSKRLIAQSAVPYLKDAVREIKAESPGILQSALIENLSLDQINATVYGKTLRQNLTKHYIEVLKGSKDLDDKIDKIIINYIAQRQQGLPEIYLFELVKEHFEATYDQTILQMNVDPKTYMVTKEDLKRSPEYQNMIVLLRAKIGNDVILEKILPESDKLISQNLILKAFKQLTDPYLESVKEFKKSHPDQAKIAILEEVIKINGQDPSICLERQPFAGINSDFTKEEVSEIVLKGQQRLRDRMIGDSFNVAFSQTYKQILKDAKIKESVFLNAGINVENLINHPTFTSYNILLKNSLTKMGFDPNEIEIKMVQMSQKYIDYKLANLEQILAYENNQDNGVSSIFSVRQGVNKGLNDKLNRGRNI